MYLRPISIKPIEDRLAAAATPEARLSIVEQCCVGQVPEFQKRLITCLYEVENITSSEAFYLIQRLGLKEV